MALQVNAYMQEFLMKLSPTGEVEPNLAESVEQPDDLTYVYTLRDDVTFSNGDPLTAEDVVVSLDYERDPSFQNPGATRRSPTSRPRTTARCRSH